MRRAFPKVSTRLVIAALVLWASAATAGELDELDTPYPAPALELPDTRDARRSLEDHRGNVVLVNFWASWCPPCLVEIPSMARLAQQLGNKGLVVLAVNVGESEFKAARALDMLGFTQPSLLDGSGHAAKAWGVTIYPTSFLVDSEGRIRFRALGPLEWDDPEVIEAVEALIAESSPPASLEQAASGMVAFPVNERRTAANR